jgi:hypothetical protein
MEGCGPTVLISYLMASLGLYVSIGGGTYYFSLLHLLYLQSTRNP